MCELCVETEWMSRCDLCASACADDDCLRFDHSGACGLRRLERLPIGLCIGLFAKPFPTRLPNPSSANALQPPPRRNTRPRAVLQPSRTRSYLDAENYVGGIIRAVLRAPNFDSSEQIRALRRGGDIPAEAFLRISERQAEPGGEFTGDPEVALAVRTVRRDL